MKPCRVLNMFLTFCHLRPYVLIWFVLTKKYVFSYKASLLKEQCERPLLPTCFTLAESDGKNNRLQIISFIRPIQKMVVTKIYR